MKNKEYTKISRLYKSKSSIFYIIVFAAMLSMLFFGVSGCGAKSEEKKRQDRHYKDLAEYAENYAERARDINFYSWQMIMDACENGTDIEELQIICRRIEDMQNNMPMLYDDIEGGTYVGTWWQDGGGQYYNFYLLENVLEENGIEANERTRYLLSAYVVRRVTYGMSDTTIEELFEEITNNKYLEDIETPAHFEVNLIEKDDEAQETGEKVWFTYPIEDSMVISSIFTDADGRPGVAAVTRTDEMGLTLSLTISGIEEQLDYESPVEMQVNAGEGIYLYALVKAPEKANRFYMMDYYSYVLRAYYSLKESVNGDSRLLVYMLDEMEGYTIDEMKALYDVKGMISLLYDRNEDARCIISNGENEYTFTIQSANFKSEFDSVWDYNEVCVNNNKQEQEYNEILNSGKALVESDKKNTMFSAEDNAVDESKAINMPENDRNEDAVSNSGIEFPRCPVVIEYYDFIQGSMIRIDSFEVISTEYTRDNKIRINYRIEGISTEDSPYLKLICYDSDEYSIGTNTEHLNSVLANKPFKIKDYVDIDANTVRVEFAAP